MLSESQIKHLLAFVCQIWNDGCQSAKMTDEQWDKIKDTLPQRIEYSLRHVLADLDEFPEEPEVSNENNVVFVDFVNRRKL